MPTSFICTHILPILRITKQLPWYFQLANNTHVLQGDFQRQKWEAGIFVKNVIPEGTGGAAASPNSTDWKRALSLCHHILSWPQRMYVPADAGCASVPPSQRTAPLPSQLVHTRISGIFKEQTLLLTFTPSHTWSIPQPQEPQTHPAQICSQPCCDEDFSMPALRPCYLSL